MFVLIAFIVGITTGSFLNVCIYRLPRKKSLIFPSSHCPYCHHKLKPSDLVPVLSYLWLKGRCRYCKARITWRYPVVELLTGVLFAILYSFLGLNCLLIKYIYLTSLLLIISFIDLEYYLIPDKLILAMLVGGMLINAVTRDLTLTSILWGMFVPAAVLATLAVFTSNGIGGGDIKLAGATGLFLGWPANPVALFLACLLAGMAGSILLLLKLKKRKDPIPFAPFFAAGVLMSICWGESLLKWYFSLS